MARAEKITRLTGQILQSNHAMLRLCRSMGFALHEEAGAAEIFAELRT